MKVIPTKDDRYAHVPLTAHEEAADSLVRRGIGVEYLDLGAWRVVRPDESVFEGEVMCGGSLLRLASQTSTFTDSLKLPLADTVNHA